MQVVLLLLGAGDAGVGCGDDLGGAASGRFTPLEPDTLTVATTFPAAGFWEGADVDHIDGGFEYELARELADQLGLDQLRVVDVAFDDLVAGEADGFDLALDQVSITRERAQVVDLSRPYLTTPVGVVGRAGADVDVADLAAARELTWAVEASTTQVDLVDDLINPEDDPRVYPTIVDVLDAVVRGDVDVAAVDYLRALAEVDADDRLVLAAQVTAPQHYAALLPRGSGNLEAVDAAMRALAADGTLRDLRRVLYRRFDVDQNDVPTIRVSPDP